MNETPHKKEGGNHDKREKIFVFGHNYLIFRGFGFNFINKFDKTIKMSSKPIWYEGSYYNNTNSGCFI